MIQFAHRMIFIRHGETSYNAEDRLQGQRDIPLDDVGRRQALDVGRKLREGLGEELARLDAAGRFYCSPLARTRETMQLARGQMALDPTRYVLVSTLEELTFGRWEGKTWPELEASEPALVKAREEDKWGFRPPGGESYADLAERVKPWLLACRHDCFVAAHGGVARAFMHLIAGMPSVEAASAPIAQGKALIFENGAYAWFG